MRLCLALLLTACADPVQHAQIEALGPEQPKIAKGPLHRAGQPCLTCHDGGHARAFSIAGTVYAREGEAEPAAGVRVQLSDSAGKQHELASNFFVEPSVYTPVYPLWVTLESGDARIEMDSPIQRDGSCASCHREEANASSAGPVYLLPALAPGEILPPREACP